MLNFNLILSVSAVFFPVTVFLAPVLKWLIFKVYYLQLEGYSLNPEIKAADESTAVLINLI